MTAEMENEVLELLHRIRSSMDRMELDIADLKFRMSAIERRLGQTQIQFAALNGRMDRFDERLSRIERRLDLVDVPKGRPDTERTRLGGSIRPH